MSRALIAFATLIPLLGACAKRPGGGHQMRRAKGRATAKKGSQSPNTADPGLAKGLVRSAYRLMLSGKTLVAARQFKVARKTALHEKRLDLAAFADAFAGLCLSANKRNSEARTHFERAMTIARGAKAWRPYALAAEGLARIELRKKNGPAAAKRALEAMDASLRTRDGPAAGIAAEILVAALGTAATLSNADLHKVLLAHERPGHPAAELADLILHAANRTAHTSPATSARRNRLALRLADRVKDDSRAATALANLGYLHLRAGQLGTAKQILKLSLRRAMRAAKERSVIHASANLAQVHKLQGDLLAARRLYGEALDLSRKVNDHYFTGVIISNLARIHEAMGDLERALSGDREALRIHRKSGPWRAIATDLNNVGSTLMRMGRDRQARDVFAEARDLAERRRDHDLLEAIYLNLGMLEKRLGRPEEARKLYRSALRSIERVGKLLYRPIVLNNLAWLDVDAGRCDEAMRLFRRASADLLKRKDPITTWTARYGMARCAMREKDVDRARRLLDQAISVAEQQRKRLAGGTRGAQLYAAKMHHLYRDAVDLALRGQATEQALNLAERARARTLLESLAGGRAITRGAPPLARKRLRDARGQVIAAERALARAQVSGEPLSAQRRLEEARRALDSAAEEVRLSATSIVATKSLPELQAALPQGAAVLEFVPLENDVAIFVIRRSALHATRSAVPLVRIRKLVRQFREAIGKMEAGATTGRYKRALRALYSALVAPVRARLDGVRSLYLVPSGILNLLPFGALLDGNQSLIESYSLTVLPAASALTLLRRPLPKRPTLLAIANPKFGQRKLRALPASEAEARAVTQLFPGALLLVGEDAAETRLKEMAPRMDILHLATHGEPNAAAPQFSTLYLAPTERDDGRLEVHELLGLDLRASLVVLSACRTGVQSGIRTSLPAGEEFVGLVSALLQAGSAAVVATLWSVGDRSTATLMRHFYEKLPSLGRAGALRAAQLEVRKKWPHPFYWAPFILVGDGS